MAAPGPAAPLLLLAAGGTGGHMFPAQALAEAMLARGWRVRLSTDARGARYTQGFPAAVTIETLPSASFARAGPLAKLVVPLRLLAGVIAARRQMRADRPAVVAGFGGYPSIPALATAGGLRIPRLIHEQNGVLGQVNARFAPRVNLVCCGTWPTALPSGVRALHTGNPVRAQVRARAGAPFPGTAGRLGLVVIGGSQGARALSDLTPAALAALPPSLHTRLDVAHQARPEDLDRVTHAYAQAGIAAVVRPFFDDLPARLAASVLVIGRAGASSIADLTVIGRPAILIPYPYAAAAHQSANARPLAESGAAVVLPEAGLDAATLSQHVAAILGQPGRAEAMAAAALALGRPDAAERLADLAEALAAGRPIPEPEHRNGP